MKKYIISVMGIILLASLASGASNCRIDQTAIQISSENSLERSSLIQTGYSEASAGGTASGVFQQTNQVANQDVLSDSVLMQDVQRFGSSNQNNMMPLGDNIVNQYAGQVAVYNTLGEMSTLIQSAGQFANSTGEYNYVEQASPQFSFNNDLTNSTLMQEISEEASIDGINCSITQMVPQASWTGENPPGQLAANNSLLDSNILQAGTNIASIEPDYYVNGTEVYYNPSVGSGIVQNILQDIENDELDDSTIAETSENIARIVGGELQVDWLPCV